jgi:ribosomal protein L37AE/L43A
MTEVNEQMLRAQKLKNCKMCKRDAEPTGGVEVWSKWYCSKCWAKALYRGAK